MLKVKARGLLEIGDPHVSSRKPGTRNDKKFVETVIGKIEQAAVIANERNLQAMFTGDLLDRDCETDCYLLVRLVRALNMFNLKPIELLGNHTLNEVTLTDNTTLALLREAAVLHVIDKPGMFLIIDTPDQKSIGVGATPYGMTIPEEVSDIELCAVDSVIWQTHHDLAFDGAYPGAQELFEIKGCDLVVNGHMHLTKSIIAKGKTRWFNPGNITRQSKDTATHVPSVWEILSGHSVPTQIPLKYEEKIFDVIESFVPVSAPDKLPASAFVATLQEYNKMDIVKTEDGSVLAADLNNLCEKKRVTHDVLATVMDLHKRVVA